MLISTSLNCSKFIQLIICDEISSQSFVFRCRRHVVVLNRKASNIEVHSQENPEINAVDPDAFAILPTYFIVTFHIVIFVMAID